MTLIRLFPFLIGEFVPEDDDHWRCFLLLWDICAMVCVFETSKDKALQLAWLVQTYLEAFTSTYGASYITPKFHHLVHLPDQIIM